MYHATIRATSAWGVGLNETFLSQELKKQGYSTHAVGKVYKFHLQEELSNVIIYVL